ncbi:hypothetical protein EYZ11_008257 [Aspergillus tanneri]|nr:hypothetical protein EYZ11_008257 [Aspergillus tanneri]
MIVEGSQFWATAEAELEGALADTWGESDMAESNANCKRGLGKSLKNLRRLEYNSTRGGDALFHSTFNSRKGVLIATVHYKKYISKVTGRKGLAIGRATAKSWTRAQVSKKTITAMVDRFGRQISQAFAGEAGNILL